MGKRSLASGHKNWMWRIKRYQSIQETQSRGLRKRFLLSGFSQGTIGGAYVSVSSATSRYSGAVNPGYSKAFASEVIGSIRTDLDAFSDVEQAVLVNHGYALIDSAVRTHVPGAIVVDAPFALPLPEAAASAPNEDALRKRLAGSEKRKVTGRT